MNTKIFLSLISFLLIGGGCFSQGNNIEVGNQPIDQLINFGEFDENKISTGMPVEGSTSLFFTADALFSQAEECGSARSLSYYQDLMSALENVQAQTYYFEAVPNENYQKPNGWTVTAVPNVLGYQTMESFQADFDICAVGGKLYPLNLNANTLLFSSSCGSGYADDSGRENGCEVVSEAVGPTIKIK